MFRFSLGEGLQEPASEVAREKPIEANKTQTKRPRGVCRLHSEGYLQTIRGRAGSGPFSSIVFSHEAIRCRSHFERGIFRALNVQSTAKTSRVESQDTKQISDGPTSIESTESQLGFDVTTD